MKNLTIALIAGIAVLGGAVPARADDASKLAKAEDLLQLVQGDQLVKMMEPMMNGMMATLKPDMPAEQRAKVVEMQQKTMALVTDRVNKARPVLAKVYSDTYTEDELNGILAFYHSPVGKSFLEKMPQVMQHMMPVMMQMISGLQPEIQKATDEIKQNAK